MKIRMYGVGDESVGIWDTDITITGLPEIDDEEEREHITSKLKEAFEEICDTKLTIEFEDSTQETTKVTDSPN